MTPSFPGPPTGACRTRAAIRDTGRFLAEILRHPRQLGAVCPSGPRLAAQAAQLITQGAGPQVVVEIGPGSGVITDALAARLPPGSVLVAVEVNAVMVAHLRRTRPWLRVIHGDAADLPDLLAAAGTPAADLIVSALPWSLIPAGIQRRLVRGIASVLDHQGTFATVSTLPVRAAPGTRRLRRELAASFAWVHCTRPVWRNIPPAHLYVCRQPRFRPPPTGTRGSGPQPDDAASTAVARHRGRVRAHVGAAPISVPPAGRSESAAVPAACESPKESHV